MFVAILGAGVRGRGGRIGGRRRFRRVFRVADGLLDRFEAQPFAQELQPQAEVDRVRAAIGPLEGVPLDSLAQLVERFHHRKQAHVGQDEVVLPHNAFASSLSRVRMSCPSAVSG